MSILCENENGTFISHQHYINDVYREIGYQIHPDIFNIAIPYKNTKKKKRNVNNRPVLPFEPLKEEIDVIQQKYDRFKLDLLDKLLVDSSCSTTDNCVALTISEGIYKKSGEGLIQEAFGTNIGPPVVKNLGETYLFPRDSTFYAKDVLEITRYINTKYDLIVLDPPWWNKYIRRKRKRSDDGYKMMYNVDLKNIPLENLLHENSIVVVWCTNSKQHFDYLVEDIFPKWQIEFVAKWFWLKVTSRGDPVCQFSEPPGKQPFEKIVIGCRKCPKTLPKDKLVVSVPSALHSHKPPLVELLSQYLPDQPLCLELFARYLLPGWTSYGNEVLKFQHQSLYVKV